jgi:hypothetical protein
MGAAPPQRFRLKGLREPHELTFLAVSGRLIAPNSTY